MRATTSRPIRVVEVLPVLAGLCVHAMTHARWFLVAPLLMVVVLLIMFDVFMARTNARVMITGVLGAVVGVVVASVAQPPPGPFPPVVLGGVCGALMAVVALCVASHNTLYAWTYAWVLVALSVNVEPSPSVYAALVVLAVSTLLAVFVRMGVLRSGGWSVLGLAVYAGLVIPAAWGVAATVRSNEGMLVGAVYRIIADLGLPTGLGFDPQISLATTSRIQPTMRRLLELSGSQPRRLRTVVMDAFDGQTWRVSETLARETGTLGKRNPSVQEGVVELEALEELGPFVPSPGGTSSVDGVPVRVEAGGILRGRTPPGLPLTLRFPSHERTAEEPVPRPEYLALPDGLRAEMTPLARVVAGKARHPRQMAEAVEAHFQAHHEYSLNTDLRGSGHPLAVLVRENRPAYCVYFASAMAVMMRSLGVPARVVGGFVPEERNRLTGRMVVRERDAHAWVEIYLPEERRFVAFDPTPSRGRSEVLGLGEGAGLLSSVFQAIRSALVRLYLEFRHAPDQWMVRVLSSPPSILLMIGITLWQVIKRWRMHRVSKPRPAMRTPDRMLHQAYARYLRVLKKCAHLSIKPADTDQEMLCMLRQEHGEAVADAAARFVHGYHQLRYRGVAEQGETWMDALTELERLLAQSQHQKGNGPS